MVLARVSSVWTDRTEDSLSLPRQPTKEGSDIGGRNVSCSIRRGSRTVAPLLWNRE